ncbi:CopG family transcriptional regulator [Aquisalimonas sp. 2447]|uniref:DUF411 domain-containing protein n=1 Tax=Aquisalimonas sp. 2447 TaxID=2740807 RepID=UPI0014326ECF|nr:DUF411 domain-containing protein [Aquisalimonas sp. 2447]QIT54853.1 CopG family transcriptional regulator [Aquisalimonas sp. 2447]
MRNLMFSIVAASGLLVGGLAHADHDPLHATLYKNPQCGCCEAHADHLRGHGFTVDTEPTHEIPVLKHEHGVTREMAGCHTTLVDGYVVEGYVHADLIHRLLEERPEITGISLPGMPTGSPGMPGPKPEPLEVHAFDGEEVTVFGTQ